MILNDITELKLMFKNNKLITFTLDVYFGVVRERDLNINLRFPELLYDSDSDSVTDPTTPPDKNRWV